MEKIKSVISQIEMPQDMQLRIIENCRKEDLRREKKRGRGERARLKMAAAAASFVLCVLMMGGTALALSGRLEGFFRDVKRWDGAVVGTVYEQATDEVKMDVTDTGEELELKLSFLYPEKAPYRYFESFGVKMYKLTDSGGKTVAENDSLQLLPVSVDTVKVMIPFARDNQGEFTLTVTELVGHAKAEQPLVLKGSWSFAFSR